MAIDQLAGLGQLNLIGCLVAKFNSTLQCCLRLCFNDIVTVICFVYEHANGFLRHLNHTTTDSEVLELVVAVAFGKTHRNSTGHSSCHKWFVTRKYAYLTSGGRNQQLVYFRIQAHAK